jgi:penicillin-binding protein 1A
VFAAFLRFLGFLFSWATLGLFVAALAVFALFYFHGRDLPKIDQLADYQPATLSRVYSGQGALMDEFAKERRIFTPIDEIPDVIKHAFISAEDKNFYTHKGFDPIGIAKAVAQFAIDRMNGGNARLRGASTIPQQVAKNFLLSGERTEERKIKEIILSTKLVSALSRDKVLELYLNEIFLGKNSYGVTEAAGKYFGKRLEEITPGEAAYLAALAQRPSTLDPIRYRDAAISRRNYVLREMAENGYITQEVAQANRASEFRTVQTDDYQSLQSQLPARDYFTDEIRRQLSNALGDDMLFTGGLSIRATMDPVLQGAAARALQAQLEEYDRTQGIYRGPVARIDPALLDGESAWRSALSEVDIPRDVRGWHPAVVLLVGQNAARVGIDGIAEDEDGHFIPMADMTWARPLNENGAPGRQANSPDDLLSVGDVVYVKELREGDEFLRWSLRQIPEVQGAFMAMDVRNGRVLAMQGGFSYQHSVFNRASQATRQPGSSFKPFVYAAALDSGYTPATVVVDAPIEVETSEGIWRPQNASRQFYGPAPLRTGIEQSRNLMTVRIAQDIGMEIVGDYAERFGVYRNMPDVLSYALGAGETTLLKMVAAYAQFANGGLQVEPTLVDRVQNRYGETIYRHDQRYCESCGAAADGTGTPALVVNDARRVMNDVTAYQLTSMMQGVVTRGTAASTVGPLGLPIAGKTGTTNEAKDAWFIGFTPEIVAGCYIGFDTPTPMGKKATGGSLCGPVFAEFMQTALQTHGSFKYSVPPDTSFVKIDRFSGARLEDDASGENVIAELFRWGEEPDYGFYGSFVDGGFSMGADLLLFNREETTTIQVLDNEGKVVEKEVLTTPGFGSLSSGGLY